MLKLQMWTKNFRLYDKKKLLGEYKGSYDQALSFQKQVNIGVLGLIMNEARFSFKS